MHTVNELILTGRTQSHVVYDQRLKIHIHPMVAGPLFDLQQAAERDGIKINIISGFRTCDKQLDLWNKKILGITPLYNKDSILLDIKTLHPHEAIHAVLSWLALPGASRHHWGTDFDVIDISTMPENYDLQLIPEEFSSKGIFHNLKVWLSKNMKSYGFYLPYNENAKGINYEPWHISHRATASDYCKLTNVELIKKCISEIDILSKDLLLENIQSIFSTYIQPSLK